MPVMIEIHDLWHVYGSGTAGEVVALKGVNLRIDQGEFVAIIGSNGSGKSTLARHLNGLLLPTRGWVKVCNLDTRSSEHLQEIRRRVGMVFENPDNQLVATIVEEDVAFGPENLGLPPAEIRRRVEQALETVGMATYRNHPPHLLSGGQKQRVAIAGVLAMEPSCIVLDEPTSMLDPQGRREVLRTIRGLNESRGMTVVYITHFMEEAAAAGRVLVMDDGRIVADGPPRRIFGQTELLERIGLGVPPLTRLARRLRMRGLPVPEVVLDAEELVSSLCS